MRSLAYNPLQTSTTLSTQPSSLQLKNPQPSSIRKFHHSRVLSTSRPLLLRKGIISAIRIEFEYKRIHAGWANNATIPSLVPTFSNHGWTERRGRDFQCRAGRQPDLNNENDAAVAEIVEEELNMDVVVRDGWQWTKTNQELVN